MEYVYSALLDPNRLSAIRTPVAVICYRKSKKIRTDIAVVQVLVRTIRQVSP
jgi:hypothetical protein